MLRRAARALDSFPEIGRLLRDYRDLKDRKALTWERMPGRSFEILGGNWLAAGAGRHEQFELDIVADMLSGADILVDAGANSGIFSCLAVELGKRAFAFEPMPATLAILLTVLDRNGFADRVEVMPVAASDQVGVIPFYGRGQGASTVRGWGNIAGFDKILVPANTLDNLLADRLVGKKIVLKVDVEGAELAVLRGAGRILEFCTGLLLEISLTRNHPDGLNPDFSAIFELLRAKGFSAFVADDTKRAVTQSVIDGWITAKRNDLATENFYFLKR